MDCLCQLEIFDECAVKLHLLTLYCLSYFLDPEFEDFCLIILVEIYCGICFFDLQGNLLAKVYLQAAPALSRSECSSSLVNPNSACYFFFVNS